MAVPDFQTVMLPLLVLMGDGSEHSLAEVIENLGNRLGLSPEEKKELLPSESEPRFDNRVRWSAFYLRKAGLLERTGRGRIRITQRGQQLLQTKPQRIDVNFLKQFPEFLEFKQAARKSGSENSVAFLNEEEEETPEETLEAAVIDGANPFEIFWKIMIPQIWGTIAVVWTTITILVLKVFDIVLTMTNGQWNSQVLANLMFDWMFRGGGDFGRGATIAIIIMIAVIPIMVWNIRQANKETGGH